MTMRPIGLQAVILTLSLAAACFHVGPTADTLEITQSPRGALATVTTESSEFTGEFLALEQDGAVLSVASRLRLVPYTVIHSLTLENFGSDYTLHGEVPAGDQRARLAALSRYPAGLGVDLRQRLLRLSGQSEIEIVP